MSDETRLAFAHPEARAEAMGVAPADRISLRDYVVEVEIGAFEAERDTTQRVRFNVVVEVAPPEDPLDDDVDRILSYDTLIDAINTELSAERLNLLETLAERVADAILRDPRAARAFVRIEKLDRVPGALGVEIVRSRQDVADTAAPAPEAMRPVLVIAPVGEALPQWLDALEGAEGPFLLTPRIDPAALPKAATAQARQRVALLALDQAAWVLAAQDARCTVAGTRTEVDWALGQPQVTVCAPSKLILDATEAPPADLADPASVAGWLARHLNARELWSLGEPISEDAADIPVRVLPAPALD
jgi:dihydroneopterin aldolase